MPAPTFTAPPPALSAAALQLAVNIANLRAYLAEKKPPVLRLGLGTWCAQRERRTAELATLETRARAEHGDIERLLAAAGLPHRAKPCLDDIGFGSPIPGVHCDCPAHAALNAR